MNFALCDDNPAAMEMLRQLLLDHCAKKDWECQTTLYTHGEALLTADLSSIQAVFLDIDMPQINGLNIAQALHAKYPELLIVFVTGFIEYAPAGYVVSAFRYLLKPELQTSLPPCLDAIWETLYVSQDSIRIQQLDHMIQVRLRDILYFEGTPHRHVLLHTTTFSQPVECIGKLSIYETQLSNKGFLRLQKSFLANMYHIDDIRSYSALLDNGESLKVSTAYYSKICEQYILWKGQSL